MARLSRLFTHTALLLSTTAATAQLNGTYTIGTAGNYATFTAAVTALTTSGVSGPVVFNVFSGTYSEQLSIGNITGASTTNTITFQSQTLDSMAVVLEHPSQATNLNDWTVRLNGGDYVTFRKMTIRRSGSQEYGAVIQISAGTLNFRFENCRLLPSTATAGTQTREAVRINSTSIGTSTVDRCAIDHGSGLYAGFTTSGSIDFTNNTLTNVLIGVNLFTTSIATNIGGNSITSRNVGGSRGFLLQTVSGAMQIRRNRIMGSSGTYYGMLINALNGTAGAPIPIENNIILATNGLAGLNFTGGTNNYLDFFHNSICMSGGANPDAFAMVLGTGVSNRISNNIFYSANGPALRVTPSSRVSASDNNLIRHGGIYGVYWGLTWYYDQPSLAAGSGQNVNSMFTDPLFVNLASDLHLQPSSPCLGAGQVVATIIDDIDSEARPRPVATNPDIGADERPEQCAGLSGTYLIGPSVGADHATFSSAVSALVTCGISGPVVFEVESGIYTEQVSLPQITGSSATNSITFRSQANDSSAVVLTYPSSAVAANNFTLRMNGADFVAWNRITIERTGTSTYAQAVIFDSAVGAAGSQGTRFTHCRLRGTTAMVAYGDLILSAANGHEDSVRVEHTRFEDGTYGFRWYAATDNDLLLVQDNVFVGQLVAGLGLVVSDRSFTLRRNSVLTTTAGSSSILIAGSSAGFEVHDNRLENVLSGASAVIITAVNTSVGGDPRLYNNMIKSSSSGIQVAGPVSNLRVDHNSILAGSYGIHFSSGAISLASFRNNAILCGNFTVYRQSATTSLALSSNNALCRASVGPLAYWNAAQNTLAALQAASGGFAGSTTADPLYHDLATPDLHAYAMEADMAATPIAYITTDIDGQARSLTTPDIGADEFTPQLWADAFNTCGAADAITSTGSGTDKWIYKDRKVVARFNDNGQNLGLVQLNIFLNNGAVRTSDMGQHYLDRNWHLVTQNTWTGSILLRVFFSGNEFTAYAAADPLVTSQADAGLTQYIGVNENCLETDNPSGQTWLSFFPVLNGMEPRINAAGGANWATAVIANDGELYMSGLGQVLPVELLSFTGERNSDREVTLLWSTATEHNNAGFEVWRMIEGEDDFEEVAWVDGAGNSQQLINYELPDENASTTTSYYKLKQVDSDGRLTWTSVVAVKGAVIRTGIVAYPSPARDQLTLVGLPADATRIVLLDATGRLVRTWSNTALLGHLGDLERGVYTVGVESEEGMASVRVVLE